MDVIFYPSDCQGRDIHVSADAGHVAPKLRLELFGDSLFSGLGAEDDVNVVLGVSVCHCVAPPGLKPQPSLPRPHGLGYRYAAPFGAVLGVCRQSGPLDQLLTQSKEILIAPQAMAISPAWYLLPRQARSRPCPTPSLFAAKVSARCADGALIAFWLRPLA